MCRVSIIIPVYNCANTLADCVESILVQSYDDFELLLINDGSTDQSEELCLNLVKKDSRIHYYSLSHNGVSNARKYGRAVAKGDYIGFVDGDDVVYPDHLKDLITSIEKNESSVAICGYDTLKDGILTSYIPFPLVGNNEISYEILSTNKQVRSSKEVLPLFFYDTGIEGFLWNKLYDAKLLTEDLFVTGVDHCEDLLLNVTLFATKDFTVSFTYVPGYRYIQHESTATNTLTYFSADNTFRYEKAFEKIFAVLKEKKRPDCYAPALDKYIHILEYSMYCLLTSKETSKEEVSKMKKAMAPYIGKVFASKNCGIRGKLHFFILATLPGIYRLIRL